MWHSTPDEFGPSDIPQRSTEDSGCMELCDEVLYSWLVNLTPVTYFPQKYGFNKALLRETKGVNKPWIRPFFWGGGCMKGGGVRLTSHNVHPRQHTVGTWKKKISEANPEFWGSQLLVFGGVVVEEWRLCRCSCSALFRDLFNGSTFEKHRHFWQNPSMG